MSLEVGRHVAARCEQIGIRSYFPQLKSVVVVKGRKRARIASLWPGYVLARAGAEVDRARGLRGVDGVVRRGDFYCRLSDAQVGGLRDELVRAVGLEDEHGVFTVHPPVPNRFRTGERVRVRGTGPYAGQLVEYVSMDDESRHRAFVSILNRMVDKSFDDEELAAA
jgi:transcription antitermination factor NusG